MPSQFEITDLPGADKDKDETPKSRSSSARSESAAKKKAAATDTDLKTRLQGVFDRIAEAAEARGDLELAEVIREDREVMASGLVGLTRPLKALRAPLYALLTVVEPVMAFGRIGRLMFGRAMMRRAERAQTVDVNVNASDAPVN